MAKQKYMLIRGARIIQQIEQLEEASTYSDLERSTIQGFPNTTKRQHAVTPIQIVRTEFVPFIPTGNLRCDAVARSGPNTYHPQVLFDEVEYQDDDTPENVTVQSSNGKPIHIVPIDLSTNTCKVRCDCLDFYHRFAQYNFDADSLYGNKPPTYQRKTNTRADVNPTRTPGVCKHVMKTILGLRDAGMLKR